MSIPLARRLLATGIARLADVRSALFLHVTARTPFIAALLDMGALSEAALEQELSASGMPVLDRVEPVPSLVDELPIDICRALLAVPVRRDERTGAVDVAVVDPYDPLVPNELGFHMQSQIRLLRATFAAVSEALRRIDAGEYSSRVILQRSTAAGRRQPDAAVGDESGSDYAEHTGGGGGGSGRADAGGAGGAGAGASWGSRSTTVPPQRPSDPLPLLRRRKRRSAPPSAGRGAAGSERPLGGRGWGDPSASREEADVAAGMPDPLAPGSLRPPALPRFDSLDRSSPRPWSSRAAALPQPETQRGPFSPAAPRAPFADADAVLTGIRGTASRDGAIELLFTGMEAVAARVAVFAVRKSEFVGYACNPAFGDPDRFRLVKLPVAAPSILTDAVAEGMYLGPLRQRDADDRLLRFMVRATGDVIAVPVRIVGKPALVLVADELGDTLLASKRADDLAREAGHALARLLQAEKTGKTGRS